MIAHAQRAVTGTPGIPGGMGAMRTASTPVVTGSVATAARARILQDMSIIFICLYRALAGDSL